ncbi:phosphoenolpyruvate--protein phosphotransferase [Anaerotalea alkaliphila]|uniref:Phosphoenolpyruvate-protein phosphotransferase n=1 Tax=Anaerotalea alkaliphila TaxID=2662126 RepID=A0A7X5KM87_9FIRM|nr:phosphoenolpyruvate--protein phosphotransferase [Anaerotalea alkaliphila]NDL67549.1 phosphoenolpyruvate--protein phosphotransferase [Anaerotalea alkaliphila]
MIQGIGASNGISIARVRRYEKPEITVVEDHNIDIENQIDRFEKSMERSIDDLEGIRKRMLESANQETADIFEAHIEILKDQELVSGVRNKIRDEAVNADYAFQSILDTYITMFENMDNDYFRERAADMKDLGQRVVMHLQGIEMEPLSNIQEEVVLVAKDLTPSDTAQLDRKMIKGFVTDVGGRTSHSAIMARSLEIPAVVGTKNAFALLQDGDMVILDGTEGVVLVNPGEHVVEEYQEKILALGEEKHYFKTFRDKKSMTMDGRHVELGANIGGVEDVDSALANGAECIGLFRTEFLYMESKVHPSEEVQYEAYRRVLEKMGDKPVVVRTLDIGGDKELDYLKMEHELNPFLGNRALRLCLNTPELFRTQLRALLKASRWGNLHIMLPMVATIDELREVKGLLEEIEKELLEEDASLGIGYKLGIMVEIPATAILADVFAKEVDFFSIGTNDLIQYTFAADRMNEKVAYLYQPYNPSLLRLIKMVADAAHKEGKWVGMCGEMAGEVQALPLLMGLGLDEFSMSAPSILRIRALLSKVRMEDAAQLAEAALGMENQEQVGTMIKQYMDKLEDSNG